MPLPRVRLLAPALAALLAATILPAAPTAAADASADTARWELNRRLLGSPIVESSGLARSTYKRPVLWTHNDSGAGAKVYAVRRNGTTRATVTLGGASALDWEDIAAGPNHSLWVGDVGNNAKRRDVVQVYRFTEPKELRDRTVQATRFDLRYPDGRHNAEGIMVHPRTGRLYVVTKSESGGAVYRAPENLSTGSVNRLTRVASAPAKITAASFAPGGRRFVLCNYSDAWVYPSVGARGTRFSTPGLRQGESLEVARGGGAVFMGSEGSRSPVYKVSLPGS